MQDTKNGHLVAIDEEINASSPIGECAQAGKEATGTAGNSELSDPFDLAVDIVEKAPRCGRIEFDDVL
jgi:hypothetical protein